MAVGVCVVSVFRVRFGSHRKVLSSELNDGRGKSSQESVAGKVPKGA